MYSSLDNGYRNNSPYGIGWKTNYDISLKYDKESGQFVYIHYDGASVRFNKTFENTDGYTHWEE